MSKAKSTFYKCDICKLEYESTEKEYNGLPKKWISLQFDIDHQTTKEKHLCGKCCDEIGLERYDSGTISKWEIWDKIHLIIKRITKRQ